MVQHADIDHTGLTGVGGTPDAADVVFDPTGLDNTASTDVQAALEDFDAAISGAGGGSLTTAYAALASDQAGVSGDTETDVTGVTISLAAGTWMIWGQLNMSPGSGYSYAMIKTGSSGSGTAVSQAEDNTGNAASRITVAIMPKFVTPGSTTSYHLRGQAGGGATFNANPNSLGEATFIAALKVA